MFSGKYSVLPHRPSKKWKANGSALKLYKEGLTISHKKYTHLQDLKTVIPDDCHGFYNSLKYHADKPAK